jgi:hypothetical protein
MGNEGTRTECTVLEAIVSGTWELAAGPLLTREATKGAEKA